MQRGQYVGEPKDCFNSIELGSGHYCKNNGQMKNNVQFGFQKKVQLVELTETIPRDETASFSCEIV